MTERTIRNLAVELAGQFYDMTRSAEERGDKVYIKHRGRTIQTIEPRIFGKTFPKLKDYITGRRHGTIQHLPNGVVRHIDDGRIYEDTPGWAHWYDNARQMLVAMLARPDVDERRKEQIAEAIKEDREKQLKQEAMMIKPAAITQRHGFFK
jgi:hypothetical protein